MKTDESLERCALKRFRDRVAIVTGGASGIGAATVFELLQEGAQVVTLDLDARLGNEYQSYLFSAGLADSRFVEGDVGVLPDCARTVDVALAEFGRVDFVVNSAACMFAGDASATPEDWHRSLGVNVVGVANMVQAALVPMRESGGAVVNVASVSAYVAQSSKWTYGASKAALLSATRSMALDLAEFGIRVNSVSPGWIWTPPAAALVAGDRSRFEQLVAPLHMLARGGEPREVARAILFLCSDDASFITGTDLRVDGGYLGLGPEARTALQAEVRQATT